MAPNVPSRRSGRLDRAPGSGLVRQTDRAKGTAMTVGQTEPAPYAPAELRRAGDQIVFTYLHSIYGNSIAHVVDKK